jgi:glucuronokinase
MDLSTDLLKSRGFGEYENIEIGLHELPQLWLVYLADPSDSGKIHNDVKMRWLNGEQAVVDAMRQFADYTEQAKKVILARNWDALGDLMDANFELRRKTYGEKAIAPEMLKMVVSPTALPYMIYTLREETSPLMSLLLASVLCSGLCL